MNSFSKNRRMITRPPRPRRGPTLEAEHRKIQFVHEKVNNADQAILANPALQPIREKHRLTPVDTLNETHNLQPPLKCKSIP
jgi:hypothetical protein